MTTLERRAGIFTDLVIKCESVVDIKELLVEEFRSITRSEMNEVLRLRKAINNHFSVVASDSGPLVSRRVMDSLNDLKKLAEECPETRGYRNWDESSSQTSNPWTEDQPDGNTGVIYGKGNG